MRTIPEKESLEIEFKSDKKKLHDGSLVEAVTGLANTLGGVLYLGVEDNGEITGVHSEHTNPDKINGVIFSRTFPALNVSSKIISEEELDVMSIQVPKSQFPTQTSDGRILHRILKPDGTPENIAMRLFEVLEHTAGIHESDYTRQILRNLSVQDIDPAQISRLRNMIQTWDGDEFLLDLSDDELLQSLGMVELDPETQMYHPTVAGILTAGRKEVLSRCFPTASTAFQVLENLSVRVNEIEVLPILEAFEKRMMQIQAYNPEFEIMNGPLRKGIPLYSPIAVREALVNAFVHRDYTVLRDVSIQISEDGLTITSPGGFKSGVTLENLLTVNPHPRNPLLADILKRIGLSERTGRGIDRIYYETMAAGRPAPDYTDSTSQDIRVFLLKEDPDFQFIRAVREAGKKLGRKFSLNELLILSVLRNWTGRNLQQIRKETHLNLTIIRKSLKTLEELGFIKAAGIDEEARYSFQYPQSDFRQISFAENSQIQTQKILPQESAVLIPASQIEKMSQSQPEKTQTLQSELTPEDWILAQLQSKSSITRIELEKQFGLSITSARNLMNSLVKQGKLKKTGRSKATAYTLPEDQSQTV